MSQTQSNPTNAESIDRPYCPRCGSKMWLARVSPDEKGHEWRTFECPVCELSQEKVATGK